MHKFHPHLENYASKLTKKFSLPVSFNPEDQLKSPVTELLSNIGEILKLKVDTITEVQIDEFSGRPDIGVAVDALIAGYIELKAPGKGANTALFKGRNKKQWNKFKDLPNLIYTDGNDWALYRNGKRVGNIVRSTGDVTTDGKNAIEENDVSLIFNLLREFLNWEPIVPSSPRALAKMIAPICRLLREDVLESLNDKDSNLSMLAVDWGKYLFPDADDKQFADAYAQTLTYALLLAQLSGADDLSISEAGKSLRTGHRLLADTLKILGDTSAREEIKVPVSLLERIIAAIDVIALTEKSQGDPWLYFYEDFLAEYNPKMRKDRGVYYTPVPVVQTQVRLVSQLLTEKFGYEYSFVNPNVTTLDPAAGTGTYLLNAIEHGLDRVAQLKGPGMRARYASTAAKNIHAFEILVGPYAVAHLRLTQQIISERGNVPDDGIHVYLTDTLESPNEPPPQLPFLYKTLGEEHKRATKVKGKTPILVCLGNPPYDRQQISNGDEEKRKGGWIRFGDSGNETDAPLRDFLDPLTESGLGVHAKNLYNDYIYFWRWVLWKVFETKSGPGIVSFITASSYLRGPGFAGVRQVMRQTFDEFWIIDLEGDNLGARKTENVFAIRTPVAIAIGVRYDKPQPGIPGVVRYTRIEGTEEQKLEILRNIANFDDLEWRECLSGWQDVFLPKGDADYWDWPLLTDIFPWQENGMQFKRTWPIGENIEVLEERWKVFLKSSKKNMLFKETRDRKITKDYPSLSDSIKRLRPLVNLPINTPMPSPSIIAYRSFDRHYAIIDNRFGDFLRPTLQSAHSEKQIYITSLLTHILGEGPSTVATSLLPDLDHFRGSFGAKHVIPLWRDIKAKDANITRGILNKINIDFSIQINPKDLFAYCYAILATPHYAQKFWDELTIPGPRIPITKDKDLFEQSAALGRKLLWLHTYGERFVPEGYRVGKLPAGQALCKVGTPSTPEEYPDNFSYSYSEQELYVGKGVFENVRPEVWEFSVSGFEVIKSWLGYRMRNRSGRSSSPLDDIRPRNWEFDEEMLDLLWVLDHTIDLLPEMKQNLERILESELFTSKDFPEPTEAERKGPDGISSETPLLDFANIDIDENDE